MALVRFGLEWEALASAEHQPHQQSDCCRRIVSFWEPHGVMVVLGGEDGRRRHLDAVRAMPPGPRKLWQKALKHLNSRRVVLPQPDVSELLSISDLECLVGHVDMVGVADARCERLGMADDLSSHVSAGCGIEISRFHAIDQAACAAAARDAACSDIKAGDLPAMIWRDRVSDLVQYCREIVVVDRYCGNDVVRCGAGGNSGLEFVLRKVWDRDVSVRVLMADPRRGDNKNYDRELAELRAGVWSMVERLLEEGGPRRRDLKLSRLPNVLFGNKSHDRYLRLGTWLLALDVGLEPFSANNARRDRSAFNMSNLGGSKLAEKQEFESRLESLCTGDIRLPSGRARLCDSAV